MNKKLILIVAATIIVILSASVAATVLKTYTHTNSGTANNPQETMLDIIIDGENVTTTTNINWDTWNVGENTKSLSLKNKSTQTITVYLYITNLPQDWIVTYGSNGTQLTPDQISINTVKVTCPNNINHGQQYTFTSAITAET